MGFFDRFKKKSEPELTKDPLSSESWEELEEALRFAVLSGFYSGEEVLCLARDIAADLCRDSRSLMPKEKELVQRIERIEHTAQRPQTEAGYYLRLRAVFDQLNRERIIALHFAGYTLDDGFAEVDDVVRFMKTEKIPRQGYCFYHQQDVERAMDPSLQRLLLAFHSTNGDNQLAAEVGRRIVQLLTENSFTVMWDGSTESRIEICPFVWDKIYDGEPYGSERAIEIMRALI